MADAFRLSQMAVTSGLKAAPRSSALKKSLSHRHLVDLQLLQPTGNGVFTTSPLLQRSLDKLCALVRQAMRGLGAVELSCSALGEQKMWHTTDRWTRMHDGMFTLKDREGEQFCLQPTHEEAVTRFVAGFSPLKTNSLPLLVYQIGQKYRDELNARFGWIRAREFLMNDLYSFDACEQSAAASYERVLVAYDRLFTDTLGLHVVKARAATGDIGGSVSHEFLLENSVGQDAVLRCAACALCFNAELLLQHKQSLHSCPECGSSVNVDDSKRYFEVAHAFRLGTRYSTAFGVCHGQQQPVHMGCYGIGLNRLIAAAIDTLSHEDRIVWPAALSPFQLALIPAKTGSRQEATSHSWLQHLSAALTTQAVEFVVDDRTHQTNARFAVGSRVKSLRQLGIPYLVVLGPKLNDDIPLLEVIHTVTDDTQFLSHAQFMHFSRACCT